MARLSSVFFIAVCFASLSLVLGCDCAGTEASCVTSDDCRAGTICIDRTCVPRPDAPGTDTAGLDVSSDAGVPGCTDDSQCDGGVCRGGACCAESAACGEVCCGAAQTCFANACVTPGDECFTTRDCADGEYCEPALGGGAADAGMAPDAGSSDAGSCGTSTPRPGRCLALPTRCADGPDGGMPDAGTSGCIERCEFRPTAGRLSAELLWSWGQPTPPAVNPGYRDVWSTPAVGRVHDANCDGAVDDLDPPNVVFVSGRGIDSATGLGTCCQCTGDTPTACHTGILRVLDGRTGDTAVSVRTPYPGSMGFSGVSVALGDIDHDGAMDIVAFSGEGFVVVYDGQGNLMMQSDVAVAGNADAAFGWGGGLALADSDGDGSVEIAFGATVFTTTGGMLRRVFAGTAGQGGGGVSQYLSTFADVDGAADNRLELVAGTTAYRTDGTMLWNRTDVPDGFPGIGDFDADGRPEVVVVASGQVWILEGSTGATERGPFMLTGTGAGGPPTVADFDGDGAPEIGVAQQNFYSVLEADPAMPTALRMVWRTANHDLSSSVTGSTVFDFEGDGIAEVVYADECFLWVYDGPTGAVRFAGLTTSFTGTEASIVADVDGDGHAEIIGVSNGADPTRWRCTEAPWNAPDPVTGRPAWVPPTGAAAYQGIRVYRDSARSWVGTRPIWNQHTYHVTNVCVPTDTACDGGEGYGAIPRRERANWSLDWLNNFRQNVQEGGLFSAPDATVSLAVRCTTPLTLEATVRNLGEAILPPGVQVDFFERMGGADTLVGTARTTGSLFPGTAEVLRVTAPATSGPTSVFIARIVVDPVMPTFRECRDGNNESNEASPACLE